MASTTVQGVWVGKSQFDDAEKKFHSKVSRNWGRKMGRFLRKSNGVSLEFALNGRLYHIVCSPLVLEFSLGPMNNHFSSADAANATNFNGIINIDQCQGLVRSRRE